METTNFGLKLFSDADSFFGDWQSNLRNEDNDNVNIIDAALASIATGESLISISSVYTASATDTFIDVNNTVSVGLPASPDDGRSLTILNSALGTITINGNGNTINNNSFATISPSVSKRFIKSTSEWRSF